MFSFRLDIVSSTGGCPWRKAWKDRKRGEKTETGRQGACRADEGDALETRKSFASAVERVMVCLAFSLCPPNGFRSRRVLAAFVWSTGVPTDTCRQGKAGGRSYLPTRHHHGYEKENCQ